MYQFSSIEPDIVRVAHEGPITRADTQQLRAFLRTYRGKLLIDLNGTPTAESMREFCRVRPMLPQTALFGPPLPTLVCQGLPGKDYYMHEARQFATEAEALAWLRGDPARIEVPVAHTVAA